MSTVGNWRGPNIVKDRLVLYLDTNSPNSYKNGVFGTTWKDVSGSNYNGQLINGVAFNSDNGGYFSFDGTDDYISLGNVTVAPNLFPNTSGFTWEGWLKFSGYTGNYRNIWFGNASGGNSGFGIGLDDDSNQLYYEIYGTTGGRQLKYITTTSYLSSWNHWCCY